MLNSHFQTVSELLASARRRVIIVSAFVRSDTLSSLLSYVKKGVDIDVYARWRIADLMAGASDIGVIDVAKREGADFKVLDTLHAKIYIADDRALVGSANATNAGLGCSSQEGNLEILLDANSNSQEVQKVINVLQGKAIQPYRFTNEILQHIHKTHELMQENVTGIDFQNNWLPASLPENVLQVSQTENGPMSEAMWDCYALGVTPGIDKKRLGEIAMTQRVIAVLGNALKNDHHGWLPDKKVIAILTKCFPVNAKEALKKWNILKKWIETFSKDMYIDSTLSSPSLRFGQKISSTKT